LSYDVSPPALPLLWDPDSLRKNNYAGDGGGDAGGVDPLQRETAFDPQAQKQRETDPLRRTSVQRAEPTANSKRPRPKDLCDLFGVPLAVVESLRAALAVINANCRYF